MTENLQFRETGKRLFESGQTGIVDDPVIIVLPRSQVNGHRQSCLLYRGEEILHEGVAEIHVAGDFPHAFGSRVAVAFEDIRQGRAGTVREIPRMQIAEGNEPVRMVFGHFQNDTIDLLLIAIDEKYKNKGVNAMIFHKFAEGITKNGIKYIESTRELEDNTSVQNLWRYLEHDLTKRARTYIKQL